MEWQPIDTAPTDGTDVLVCRVYDGGHVEYAVAHKWSADDEWRDTGDIGWAGMYGYENQPTHWMPLPKALTPEISRAEGVGLNELLGRNHNGAMK